MVYKYEWSGFKYAVPASVVGAECERIEAANGSVTSESLVDSARSADSAIHGMFEWDDGIAGEKWRLQQAKVILHNLKISISEGPEQEQTIVRAYINPNPCNMKTEYFSIHKTMQDVDLMAGVLMRAEKELRAFVDKYRTLKELAKVVTAIDEYFNETEE